MNVFLVAFEVVDAARAAHLVTRIQELGGSLRCLDRVWIVSTSCNAVQVTQELNRMVHRETDGLLVIGVDPNVAGGMLPQEAWDWLQHEVMRLGR